MRVDPFSLWGERIVAGWVQAVRERNPGISERELARRLGMSRSVIHRALAVAPVERWILITPRALAEVRALRSRIDDELRAELESELAAELAAELAR